MCTLLPGLGTNLTFSIYAPNGARIHAGREVFGYPPPVLAPNSIFNARTNGAPAAFFVSVCLAGLCRSSPPCVALRVRLTIVPG